MHHAVANTLKQFDAGHLPANLQSVAQPFKDLASQIANRAPDKHETTQALRHLLRAKNEAVRAAR